MKQKPARYCAQPAETEDPFTSADRTEAVCLRRPIVIIDKNGDPRWKYSS